MPRHLLSTYRNRGLRSFVDRVRGLGLALVLKALESQIDQPIDQRRIRDARRLPQLGIHADLCKARNGVQFVDPQLSADFVQQKVHARHSRAIQGFVRQEGHLAYLLREFSVQRSRDEQLGIISCASQVARALTGHKAGDVVDVPGENGSQQLTVKGVTTLSDEIRKWIQGTA